MTRIYETGLTETGRVYVRVYNDAKKKFLEGDWSVGELPVAIDYIFRQLQADAQELILPRVSPELPEDFALMPLAGENGDVVQA